MRKPKVIAPLVINKINLLYWANDWNVTSISKSVGYSPPIVVRNLFKSRGEWYLWSEEMVAKGEL